MRFSSKKKRAKVMQLISQPIIHLNCEGAAAKSYGRRDFRSMKPAVP
jgi:hypothetical protein